MSAPSASRFGAAAVFLVVLGSILLGGCTSDSESTGAEPGTVHPKEAFLPHSNEIDHKIGREKPPEEGLRAELAAALSTPVGTLGVREGSGPELFGQIRDVTQDSQGRILVLDSEHGEVRIFGRDGAFIGAFGGRGEGPGEFRSPDHLALFGNGDLLVSDLGRMQIFEPAGNTFKRTGGFGIPFDTNDACILDGEMYLQGFTAEHPRRSIHVYSRDGERLRSLGPVYDTPDEFVRSQMTRGWIACDEATGIIAFTFRYAPLVYGFTPDDELRWTTRLSQFSVSPVEYVRKQGRRGLSYSREPGAGFVSGLVDVPGWGLLLQQLQAPSDENGEGHSIHTYWLSAPEGTGGYVGSAAKEGRYPAMIRFVNRERLLWAHQSPFPGVEMYSVNGMSWDATATVTE